MYKLGKDIFLKEVDNENVILLELLNPRNSILEVKGVSAYLLLMLVKGRSLDSSIDQILEEYDVQREQLVADCEEFIKELIAKSILVN